MSRAADGGRVVDSPHNAAVREARRLERDRTARERLGLYLAWGARLASEAVSAGAPVARVLATPGALADREVARHAERLRADGADLVVARAPLLDSIAAGAGDQGILLVVRRPRTRLADVLSAAPSLILACHGVQDPGNVGTMARSALALGAGALVALEGNADLYASRTVRAGMGAHFRLPMTMARWREALEPWRAAGLRLVAADVAGGSPPSEVDLRRPSVLVVGSEGAGLPAALVDAADARARIPMAPGAASLNVHAAAAVLLYEAARQRAFGGMD